ncbi:MAG: C39 family peptidase [Chloroflexi bacterium]|nr:C39 family peptidase [Chloroflexota bacterium]
MRLEGLTITPQKFNNCGPTNLSLVLAYFGHEADQFEIAASVRPTYEDRNVSPEELRDYVNEQTSLQAALVPHGDMGLLKQLVSADYPVIIEKGLLPNEREGWMGHYLTIFGYDDAAQTVVGMDTFLGPWDGSGRLESYATLAEFWRQFNNVLLVVYPPDQEAAITAILGEAHSDPLLTWQRSAETAQTAVTIDATDAFAWFNLGRSLTHLGGSPANRSIMKTGRRRLTRPVPWACPGGCSGINLICMRGIWQTAVTRMCWRLPRPFWKAAAGSLWLKRISTGAMPYARLATTPAPRPPMKRYWRSNQTGQRPLKQPVF